jgi:hypothetical protein
MSNLLPNLFKPNLKFCFEYFSGVSMLERKVLLRKKRQARHEKLLQQNQWTGMYQSGSRID